MDDTPADPPAARPPVSGAEALVSFEQTLRDHGARAALVQLNGFTAYRYTGVFRFVGGFAYSVFYVDRVNPEIHSIAGIPEQATYCCLVRDTAGRFITLDALIDERPDAHPARSDVRGCCGVPLLDSDGELLGTLCHFDDMPREPQALDLPLLLQAAGALASGGHVNLPVPAAR